MPLFWVQQLKNSHFLDYYYSFNNKKDHIKFFLSLENDNYQV